MSMKAQQITNIPRFGAQQAPAVSLQATTIPAATGTTAAQLDITEIINLMLTVMIVVMMMKSMSGAFEGVGAK